MELQFGKHKGKALSDPEVPTDYIAWLLETRKQDVALFQAELDRRDALEEAKEDYADRALKLLVRAVAKRYHPESHDPEATPSADEFREYNRVCNWLKEVVKQAKGA